MTTSSDQVEAQDGYVLHSRPYKETSVLVDYFTPDFGRIRGVLKGARRPSLKRRPMIQPFTSVQIGWRGRTELKTIYSSEACGISPFLQGRSLWCGLYLNELVMRLVPSWLPCPRLFAHYRLALQGLNEVDSQQVMLRVFEKSLLDELGVSISFSEAADSGLSIDPQKHYRLVPQRGFVEQSLPTDKPGYSGTVLLAIARDDYQGDGVQREAKRLMRELITPLLGGRELQSRELFKGSASLRAVEPASGTVVR